MILKSMEAFEQKVEGSRKTSDFGSYTSWKKLSPRMTGSRARFRETRYEN